MNPCPTPPVCEFGELGCEAVYWWSERENHVDGLIATNSRFGDGGIYGMCNLMDATRDHGWYAPDFLVDRPEVDAVNVTACSS